MDGYLKYSECAKKASNLQNIYKEKGDTLENINCTYVTYGDPKYVKYAHCAILKK